MRFLYNKKGFTTVEMLVYVVILALVVAGVVSAILTMGSSFNRMRAVRDLNRSADAVLERFVREAREAETIDVDVGDSTFDAHPGKLTLNGQSGDITVFEVSGTAFRITKDSIVEGDLTLPSVTVSSAVFRHITNISSEAVRLEVLLEATRGSAVISETFYVTAVLRGSYINN